MSRAEKNIKSQEVKKHDGRATNKRLPQKKVSTASMLPAQPNKAKRELISSYAVKAMKEEFGSEEQAFEHLCRLARKSFAHMKLLLEYAYGRPSDQISEGGGKNKTAPVIQFIKNEIKQADDIRIIDIEPENEQDSSQ